MRKFRFVGDPSDYLGVEKNKVYCENHMQKDWDVNVSKLFELYPEDWQEVITELQTEPKPLHKDTDLGYFTIKYLQMQGVSKGNPDIVWAIIQAKKLIEQLDNETNRH